MTTVYYAERCRVNFRIDLSFCPAVSPSWLVRLSSTYRPQILRYFNEIKLIHRRVLAQRQKLLQMVRMGPFFRPLHLQRLILKSRHMNDYRIVYEI